MADVNKKLEIFFGATLSCQEELAPRRRSDEPIKKPTTTPFEMIFIHYCIGFADNDRRAPAGAGAPPRPKRTSAGGGWLRGRRHGGCRESRRRGNRPPRRHGAIRSHPGGDLGGPETRSSALEAAGSEPYRLPTAPASTVRAITMRCTSLVPSPISPSFASRM